MKHSKTSSMDENELQHPVTCTKTTRIPAKTTELVSQLTLKTVFEVSAAVCSLLLFFLSVTMAMAG